MPRESRFSIARKDIEKAFAALPSRVLTKERIAQLLTANRHFWRLASTTTTDKFIRLLLDHTPLRVVRFAFPYRPTERDSWGPVSDLELVQSLKPEGYFSHFTAMHLHGLTDQIPKTLYLNFEQDITGGGGQLTQAAIDRAFKSKPRVTRYVADLNDVRVCLVNGRYTGNLGVIDFDSEGDVHLRVTGLERTLIDIAVRPVYAGGVFEVLEAYRRASEKVSLNRLVAYLKTLDYTYPYHQAIGFYAECSRSYSASQLDLLRAIPRHFDFYLTYHMRQTRFDPNWRLHVPEGL